jgi:hypothetical protein
MLSAASGFGYDIITPYVQVDTSRGPGTSGTNLSLCLDLKIGYNSGGLLDFYYVNKSDWMYPYSTAILNNANMLELSCRLRDNVPASSLSAAAGWAFWLYPFDWDWNGHYAGNGFCASAGFGVEFVRHLSVQLEYLFSMPRNSSKIPKSYIDPVGGNLVTAGYYEFSQTNFTNSIRLTIICMFY